MRERAFLLESVACFWMRMVPPFLPSSFFSVGLGVERRHPCFRVDARRLCDHRIKGSSAAKATKCAQMKSEILVVMLSFSAARILSANDALLSRFRR